jgi:hypothetical protein
MGEIVHEAPDPLRALGQIEERKAEQNGEEQQLEDVADLEDPRRSRLADACVGTADEGANDAVGNNVQDEVDRPNLPGRVRNLDKGLLCRLRYALADDTPAVKSGTSLETGARADEAPPRRTSEESLSADTSSFRLEPFPAANTNV